jgi:hypothetical protein
MMDFRLASFRYAPFPVGLVDGILPADLYSAMLTQFPGPSCFDNVSGHDNGTRYLLREPRLTAEIRRLGPRASAWARFLGTVYDRRFVAVLDTFLTAHHVDLGLERLREFVGPPLRPPWWRRGHVPRVRAEITLTPSGGFQRPHTDVPSKILTILIPMNEEGAWPASWGGRLFICRPRDDRNAFNIQGRYADLDEMEVAHAITLEPNRGVVFPKTHNSWHAVEPVDGTAGSWRVRRMLSVIVYRF